MSHGLKLLLIAAGAIITCIVVVVGFQLTKSGKNDTNHATEEYTNVMSEYDDVQLTMYEDMEVSGADVVSFIKENASVVVNSQIKQILISTKMSGTQLYASETYKTKTVEDVKTAVNASQKTVTATSYINPTGTFLCNIVRNSNGMITDINFTQQ